MRQAPKEPLFTRSLGHPTFRLISSNPAAAPMRAAAASSSGSQPPSCSATGCSARIVLEQARAHRRARSQRTRSSRCREAHAARTGDAHSGNGGRSNPSSARRIPFCPGFANSADSLAVPLASCITPSSPSPPTDPRLPRSPPIRNDRIRQISRRFFRFRAPRARVRPARGMRYTVAPSSRHRT